MKIFRSILSFIIIFLMFLSCQRELWFDGISSGKLVCPPVAVSGIFMQDSVLTNANFIDINVDVIIPGTFDIKSDTINGYSFSNTGSVVNGINTIRLFASGKPIVPGINSFTIHYGTVTCSVDITVTGISAAEFTLGGAPDSCTGAVAEGIYKVGTSLTAANTLTVQVNVISTGLYNLHSVLTNGFQFFKTGIFTVTGLQSVTLTGTGVPVTAGITTVTVTNIVSSCTFNITVTPPFFGTAIYDFNGSPGNCINFSVNGIFAVGAPTTAANTATLGVDVTAPGSYIINTNSADGIMFSGSGSFLTTGPQTVTLTASGTPVNTGLWTYIPNTGSITSCNFSFTVQPALPPAVFTLVGAPGDCTPGTVYGNYTVSVPLNPSNTVVVQVNITSAGTYSIATNTSNGISFSASGVFTVTGLQNVTLKGSGTPLVTGTTLLTPHYMTSTCTFGVNVH